MISPRALLAKTSLRQRYMLALVLTWVYAVVWGIAGWWVWGLVAESSWWVKGAATGVFVMLAPTLGDLFLSENRFREG